MRLTVLLIVSLIPASIADKNLPACRRMNPQNVPVFHNDEQCDRVAHNAPSRYLKRASLYESFRPAGSVAHIPNQETVVCPLGDVVPASSKGHDTKWIVKNTSSGPVVLVYHNEGREVSAVHPHISPPTRDAQAILSPGEWKAIDVYEGQVYSARQVMEDGRQGNVLLYHRPGLIGFTNRYHQDLDCGGHQDEEPLVKNEKNETERDPGFQRSPHHLNERCHIVYQGFRNMLDCPLHVYYAGMPPSSSSWYPPQSPGPMQCQEEFKFHLGLQSENLQDYMFDWKSTTKFEGTFVRHLFVARLAHNPDILVDHFMLQPTEIVDCPSYKQEQMITLTGESVVQETEQHGINATQPQRVPHAVNQTQHVWSATAYSAW